MVGEGQLALVEALDEVSLSLVLAAARSLAGPTLPREGHEPSLVPGILEGCVVVLQDDLREHAVFALPAGLWREGGRGGVFVHPTCLVCLTFGPILWDKGGSDRGLCAQGFLRGEVDALVGEIKVGEGNKVCWESDLNLNTGLSFGSCMP